MKKKQKSLAKPYAALGKAFDKMACVTSINFIDNEFTNGSITVSLDENYRAQMVISAARTGNNDLIKLALKHYDERA